MRVRAYHLRVSYYDANDGKPGVVYILRNDALRDDVFKIGQSTRSGKARASELNAEGKTGMPKLYMCVFEVSTDDCGRAEKNVHRRLRNQRMSKEFFRVELEEAKQIVREECARFRKTEVREFEYVPFTGIEIPFKHSLKDEFGASLVVSGMLLVLPLTMTHASWLQSLVAVAISTAAGMGIFRRMARS